MSTVYQPVPSDIADLFWWKTRQTLTSITVGNAGQLGNDNIKTLNNAFFVFVGWRGCSNYDGAVQMRAVVGAPAGAAATAIFTPVVPNNFEVMVKRNNRYQMMDQPLTQAQLCSTAYRAGQQVPIPIIYPPLTTFQFTIYATAPVLFTLVDGATQKNLVVDFGMMGYNVPTNKLPAFIAEWPALYRKAMIDLTGMNTAPAM